MHSPAGEVERAIHAVLGGTLVHEAAVDVSLDPSSLEDAVDLYCSAGRAALDASIEPDWYQAYVQFRDWQKAEQSVITHLWPVLQQAEAEGTVVAWWFVRKFPCWRFRIRSGSSAAPSTAKALLTQALDAMVALGAADRWWESIYEPETYALGGPAGIEIAHRLFHADSRALMAYASPRADDTAAPPPLGRRELSILLLSALMRGADQEWAEQGDIWHRVEQSRPFPSGTPSDQLQAMRPMLRRLLTLDTGPASNLTQRTDPLAQYKEWIRAFSTSGEEFGATRNNGSLTRGMRDVMERLALFHWNRMGLPSIHQSILARAAREAIFTTSTDFPTQASSPE
ncbi:thiopeptide-type bacteriocin biosynthesis protein [Streptomyces jumonjinensis]|uniref:thiopeptide-type bacteriocin biosynthesis protein n=1 Tax=Streptomyces jumonjinensis TaxID=1945 RepID=UPI0037AFBB7A